MERILTLKEFHIHPKRKTDSFILSNINGIDCFTLLEEELKIYINSYTKKKEEKVQEEIKIREAMTKTNNRKTYWHLTPIYHQNSDTNNNQDIELYFEINKNKRYICGKLSKGNYGQKGAVIDEKDQTVFAIEKNHCVPKPYFFFIVLPKNKDRGFIVTEQEGSSGIAYPFSQMIREFFKEKFQDMSITIKDYIEQPIVNKYIQDGSYKAVIMTTTLPKNIEDKYGVNSYEKNKYTIELKIKANNKNGICGNIKTKIQQLFNGESEKFLNFEEIGFNESEEGKRNYSIKVLSQVNGRERTIRMNDMNKIISGYDINVTEDSDGYSDFKSIKKATYDLLNGLNLDIFPNEKQD